MTDEEDVRPDDTAPERPGDVSAAGAVEPPPLTPSRPWLADEPRARPRAARPGPERPRAAPATPRPAAPGDSAPFGDARRTTAAFDPTPLHMTAALDPPRPWLRATEPTSRSAEPAAESPADPGPGGTVPDAGPGAGPLGLAPIRPWTGDAPAQPSAARLPQPSHPDTVLQELAAELAPDRRQETDEERRRRFARQHAAADAARRAALPPPSLDDSGPPPPSYEPDPAVYDVSGDDDGAPRKRRFGLRRRSRDVAEQPVATPARETPPATDSSAPTWAPRVHPTSPAPRDDAVGVPAPSYDPDPAVVEPVVVEPAVVEPAAVEPAAVEPAAVEPAAVEPAAVEPAAVEPAAVEPAAVEPAAVEPAAVEPAAVEPAAVEPEPVAGARPDVEAAPSTAPAEPGPFGRLTRWLFARSPAPATAPDAVTAAPVESPDPSTEAAPAAIDVTDEPRLDLELAEDFPPPPEPALAVPDDAPVEPAAEQPQPETLPGAVPTGGPAVRTRRGWWHRRGSTDEDEGPFFPPEGMSTTEPLTVEPPATEPTVVHLPNPEPDEIRPDAASGTGVPAAVTSTAPPPVPQLDLPPVASVLDDVPLPAASEVPAVPVSRNRPRPRPRPTTDAAPPSQPSADNPPPPPTPARAGRPRPRPRPAAARAAASPSAETSTEPDPAGSPAPPAGPPAPPAGSAEPAVTGDEPDYRSPDISRYLAAEDAPKAQQDKPTRRLGRRGARASDGERRGRRRLRGSRGLRIATRLVIVVVVAVAAAAVLRAYVVAPYYIPSASMEPALVGGDGRTSDRILVDKVTYRIHDPHQGDIVVFDRPDAWPVTYQTYVKRIIGLPGDIVSLRNGLVYVNGMRLTEKYFTPMPTCPGTAPLPPKHLRTWTVPMDDYFVMGDNRCNSEDSREFGPVPDSKIVGRAFLIVWPLSRFGTP